MPSLAQDVEKTMAARRRIEAKHKDLIKFSAVQKRQASENHNNQMTANKARQNKALILAAENMFEENDRNSQRKLRADQRERQQTEALAQAMQIEKNNRDRSEREIQRICEGSDVLKDLESQLKVAYMNKERANQVQEAVEIKLADHQFEAEMAQQMEINRQQALLEMERMELHRRAENEKKKGQLEDQMAYQHEQMLEESTKAAAEDKKMVDDVMRKIAVEDYQEYMAKNKKVQDTVVAIKDYETQRIEMINERERKFKEEEDRILAYARAKGAREATIKASQDQKKAADERRFKQIEKDMAAKRAEQEEFNMLRDMLWAEETENRLREAEQKKQAARDATKVEMKLANVLQKEMKAMVKKQEEDADALLSAQLQQKYNDDHRLDIEAGVKRSKQREIYKTSIQSDVDRKKDMYRFEKLREADERAAVAEEQAYKERVIEAARNRLLAEHAGALAGFLPKGVLSTTEDLKLIQSPKGY